jgi:hypothetical protein
MVYRRGNVTESHTFALGDKVKTGPYNGTIVNIFDNDGNTFATIKNPAYRTNYSFDINELESADDANVIAEVVRVGNPYGGSIENQSDRSAAASYARNERNVNRNLAGHEEGSPNKRGALSGTDTTSGSSTPMVTSKKHGIMSKFTARPAAQGKGVYENLDDAAKEADYNTGHKKGTADKQAGKENNSAECISDRERKGYADGYNSLAEGWFSKDKPAVEPQKANVGDVVTITKTHPQLDIIPGDQYRVNTSDSEGVTIDHGLGTRYRDVKVPHTSYRMHGKIKEGWGTSPHGAEPARPNIASGSDYASLSGYRKIRKDYLIALEMARMIKSTTPEKSKEIARYEKEATELKAKLDSMQLSDSTNEGWESGPDEREPSVDRSDWDYDQALQDKLDAKSDAEPKKASYKLNGRGPNMEPNWDFGLDEFETIDAAKAERDRLMADPSTPNPTMIGIQTINRTLKEWSGQPTMPLRSKEDYMAKRKTLTDLQADPDTAKDLMLKNEVIRRLAALQKQWADMREKETAIAEDILRLAGLKK